VVNRFRRGLPLLGLVLLLSACSLFDGSGATPTAQSPENREPPPLGTPAPTPLPPQPGDTISISWKQVQPQAHENELDRPFQDLVKTNAASGSDLWRLYTVTGDSAPRLELETRRWLVMASWVDNGAALLLSYATRYQPGQDTQGGPRRDPDPWGRGAVKLTPGAPAPQWDLRLQGSPSATPGSDFAIVPGGDTGDTVLLLRSDGTLWAAAGAGFNSAAAPSPDGRRLVLTGRDQYEPDGDKERNFIAAPLGAEAVLAGYGDFRVWSPDSSRLALVRSDGVSLFTPATEDSATIGINTHESPNWPIVWSPDGRYLAVRDGLIDADAGRVVSQPTGRELIDAAFSPDGRWLALTLEFNQGTRTTCDGPGLRNQTLLIAAATGTGRAIFDCNRFFSRIEWLGNERLLAFTNSCWACEGKSQLFLVSVADASAQPLNRELGFWINYDVSPDGSKVLVTGDQLRLYTASGTLLRSIPVEDGYAVTAVQWSPDGTSFTYIVGPKDFVVL
jgi:hypothetical protein